MIVGYVRVSTHDQHPASQEAEVRAHGAEKVFVAHGETSRISERPEWLRCLGQLREGDTVVIRALDRIAGSERLAIEMIRDLARRGV